MLIELNDDNFDVEVINSDIPVFIDFWAEWCNPCKMIAPMIKELAEQYDGKVKVCKANLDDCPQSFKKFKLLNLPTFLLFKDGEVVKKEVGVKQKKDLQKMIEEVVENN